MHTVKKLYEADGEYFESKTPAYIFGAPNNKVYVVFSPRHIKSLSFIIAEIVGLGYDYDSDTCYNIQLGKKNIPFNEIPNQYIHQGTFKKYDVSNYEVFDNAEDVLNFFYPKIIVQNS